MLRARIHSFINVTIFISLILLQVSSLALAADDAGSLRQFLTASKNVAEVYPIDDFLTLVIPDKNIVTSGIKGDFDKEFFTYCRAKGELEVQSSMPDPLTGKQSDAWTPLKLDEKERFTNPRTGGAEKFSFDMLYLGITVKGGAPMPLRIKDYMEIAEVFKSDRDNPKSFIVKTKAAQPFLYKIKSIPPYDKVVMPLDGDLAKNVSEIKDSRSGSLFKSAPLQKDADIFVFLTAICLKNKLTPKYLINEGEFVPLPGSYFKYLVNNAWQSGYFKVKLKEIPSNLEMFKFMADLDGGKNKFTVWYFQGQGDRKFVSKGAEERVVDEKGAIKVQPPQVAFANDRDLTGIEFAPIKKDEPAPAAAQPVPEAAKPKEEAAPAPAPADNAKPREDAAPQPAAGPDAAAPKAEPVKAEATAPQPVPAAPSGTDVKK